MRYRIIPCPVCKNPTFRFAGHWEENGAKWVVDPPGLRECHGPKGCGHVWDPGPRGREVVE